MVFAIARLFALGFVVMTVMYVLVSLYSSSVRREKLEKQWDADHPDGSDPGSRRAFIETGMAAYQDSFRPKLILLVYVIPTVLVIAALVVTNWN